MPDSQEVGRLKASTESCVRRSQPGVQVGCAEYAQNVQYKQFQRGNIMEQSEVLEGVVKILTPWVKNQEALAGISMDTNILEDLKVNSARLVDVVIAFEDEFDIEIEDEDVDTVNTVGDAVNLIVSKLN
jgi:acyl carrier protein